MIQYIQKQLQKIDLVHCDETPIQVLKEDGKKPKTKSYIWLYRSGKDGKSPIILSDYRPSRNRDNVEEYLKGVPRIPSL